MLRALVTGAGGFAGSHLVDYLLSRDDMQVHGVDSPTGSRNLEHVRSLCIWHSIDLREAQQVRELITAVRPDYIFHLAAQSSVSRAWADPSDTLVTNIILQLNLLQACVEIALTPRVLVVGSADEYGLVRPEEPPIHEDAPLRPLNPYAVSKIAQDFLGYQYYLSHGLHVVRVRPFNHIGPGQGPGFVVADFAQQIAEIEAGLRDPVIRVGNLSAVRDFTDVRDMVRGYYLALAKGRAGAVYNIGSSRAWTIQEVLDRLMALSRAAMYVEVDPRRLRPSDIPRAVCDARRFRADTGWEPTIELEQSLRDVLDDWRQRVRA